MNVRKYVSLITVTVIVSLVSTSIWAAQISNKSVANSPTLLSGVLDNSNCINFLEVEKSIENVSAKYSKQVDGQIFDTTEVINAKDIAKLAKVHGFKNAENISKIELVKVTPIESTGPIKQPIIQPINQAKRTIQRSKYFAWNTVYKGTGYYWPSKDLIWNPKWDGPDNAVFEETRKYHASYNCSVSISASVVEAAVGYDFDKDYEVKFTSNTTVPSGYKLDLKVYRTYEWKQFEVWEKPDIGLPRYVSKGDAYKPNGSYFAKAWYDLKTGLPTNPPK